MVKPLLNLLEGHNQQALKKFGCPACLQSPAFNVLLAFSLTTNSSIINQLN